MCFSTTTEESTHEVPTPHLDADGTSLLISCSHCSVRVHTSEFSFSLGMFVRKLFWLAGFVPEVKWSFQRSPLHIDGLFVSECFHYRLKYSVAGKGVLSLRKCGSSACFLSGCYGVSPVRVTKDWKCARCKANALTEVKYTSYAYCESGLGLRDHIRQIMLKRVFNSFNQL